MNHRSHRLPARVPALLAALLTTLLGVSLLAAQPAGADDWPGHPNRHLVRHVISPGDTATGLAVRYHAWTAELLRLNGLDEDSYLVVGRTLRIPVVVRRGQARHHAKQHHRQHVAHHAKPRTARQRAHDQRMRAQGWRHWRHDRATVKRIITLTARRHDVPPTLAQAVGWMESGWHQPVVSSAGAIGVMQVLPTTGDWMSLYAGRPLNLRHTHDNITAGVLLLKVLAADTSTTRRAIGAYYQGLGAVRRHGLYPETRRYVDNVTAIRARLKRP